MGDEQERERERESCGGTNAVWGQTCPQCKNLNSKEWTHALHLPLQTSRVNLLTMLIICGSQKGCRHLKREYRREREKKEKKNYSESVIGSGVNSLFEEIEGAVEGWGRSWSGGSDIHCSSPQWPWCCFFFFFLSAWDSIWITSALLRSVKFHCSPVFMRHAPFSKRSLLTKTCYLPISMRSQKYSYKIEQITGIVMHDTVTEMHGTLQYRIWECTNTVDRCLLMEADQFGCDKASEFHMSVQESNTQSV